MGKKKLNLYGKKFNRLTAIRPVGTNKYNNVAWECVCDCGGITTLTASYLSQGTIKNCGCLQKEVVTKVLTTHSKSKRGRITPEYACWNNMKSRCYSPKWPAFKHYGGRGIRVCERWLLSFENFLADMGERPSNKHSIDRFPNNDGNYEPSNCRWATRKEQSSNQRKRTKRGKYKKTKQRENQLQAL